MCIHGVEYDENDDITVINKLKRCCDEIGVKFDMNEIDRVHYIGKPLFDSDSMQKVRIMANSLLYSSPKKFYERQGETRCQEF